MASKLANLLLATLAAGFSMPVTAAEPIKFLGTTGAHGELRRDALRLIVPFGGYECPSPSEIRTAILNSSMISRNASYYSPVLGTVYERWEAKFCGKTERFMVKFIPDPKGGTFVVVDYPYPAGAPTGM